jgi:hypothetical protein
LTTPSAPQPGPDYGPRNSFDNARVELGFALIDLV